MPGTRSNTPPKPPRFQCTCTPCMWIEKNTVRLTNFTSPNAINPCPAKNLPHLIIYTDWCPSPLNRHQAKKLMKLCVWHCSSATPSSSLATAGGLLFCPCSCNGCLLGVYSGGDRGGEGSRAGAGWYWCRLWAWLTCPLPSQDVAGPPCFPLPPFWGCLLTCPRPCPARMLAPFPQLSHSSI